MHLIVWNCNNCTLKLRNLDSSFSSNGFFESLTKTSQSADVIIEMKCKIKIKSECSLSPSGNDIFFTNSHLHKARTRLSRSHKKTTNFVFSEAARFLFAQVWSEKYKNSKQWQIITNYNGVKKKRETKCIFLNQLKRDKFIYFSFSKPKQIYKS